MALVGATWSSAFEAEMDSRGFTGSRKGDLADAVGIGSVSHVVGKAFVTVDTGLTPAAGVGAGVGIIGYVPGTISSALQSKATASFGQAGDKLDELADAVDAACIAQMALATLVSSHTPVYLGTGVITPGSVTVVPAGWASAIESEGTSLGFTGSEWSNLADAIGESQADETIAKGTGTVAITGPPPGIPVPGSGAGTGTIS